MKSNIQLLLRLQRFFNHEREMRNLSSVDEFESLAEEVYREIWVARNEDPASVSTIAINKLPPIIRNEPQLSSKNASDLFSHTLALLKACEAQQNALDLAIAEKTRASADFRLSTSIYWPVISTAHCAIILAKKFLGLTS